MPVWLPRIMLLQDLISIMPNAYKFSTAIIMGDASILSLVRCCKSSKGQ